ncbi:MAG: EamA family transporter [Alphaproteobacteria bacterium]|nr:EamA family transporter [Alphaproteobacteria bacterium]
MDALVFVAVLAAALGHASWNALVKGGGDHLVTTAQLNVVTLACGLALLPWCGPVADAALPYLIASIVIHDAYFFALIMAYRAGDFSRVYPIARGSAPLAVAVLSHFFAAQALAPWGWFAVLLVSAGIASLALIGARRSGAASARAVAWALATGTTTVAYTFIDGLGVRANGEALSYTAWLFIGCTPAVAAVALWRRGPQVLAASGASWLKGGGAGALAILSYGLVLWGMSLAPFAYVAALRETSVVFAAIIGTRLMGEPFGRARIAAALAVVVGLVLLRVPG